MQPIKDRLKSMPSVLLVEGETDKRVFPELLEQAGIKPWVMKDMPRVRIDVVEGVDELLKLEGILTRSRVSSVKTLGIVLDADEEPTRRWDALRNRCLQDKVHPLFPAELPEDGLVLEAHGQAPRFGIWMMPNNLSKGMLETFLTNLVPDGELNRLFQHARDSALRAKGEFQAPYKEVHLDKVLVHTWLAWQEEPGQQLHTALKASVLKPREVALAQKFVAWFCRLYQLQLTPSS